MSNKNLKRKKKPSAFQLAKKAARQGDRTGNLDNEAFQYVFHILETISKEWDPNMEDRDIFINNVYEQVKGKEVDFARNKVGSRVIEHLITYGDIDLIQKFDEAFSDALRPMCGDMAASFVIQKLMSVCAQKGNPTKSEQETSGTAEVKDSEIEKYNKIAFKLCKYAINNIEEFVWDRYANHVLRTALECLGGLISVKKNNDKSPQLGERRKVTKEYENLLVAACKGLLKFPQFQEFCQDDLTSGFVQSVLYSLKDVDSDVVSAIIGRVNTECFKRNTQDMLSNIFINECSVRLLEACIAVSNPKDFTEIYERYFQDKLGELSIMKSANFSVQRLLENCHTKEDMEKIFDEIVEYLPAILEKRYTGVFASLSKACARLHAKQGPFVNAMFKLLHCDEPIERHVQIVPLTAMLKTFEDWESVKDESKNKFPINIHGSLTVQAMLSFNKPIKIVTSLLDLNAEDLVKLFDDPKGSRIVDAFMQSQYIGEKSRERLAKKLQGTWVKLACSKHGSWCLEKIWAWAKLNQQYAIMEELASVGQLLCSTESGKLISSKLNVPLFARNKKDWAESQGKEDKTEALFADII
ncbi:hypothetical protein QAD02_004616, partial [Eretmocerus hayati]